MCAKLGILISGTGTNLQSIIDSIKRGSLRAEIGVVISNVEDAYGLIRAKKENIPAYFLDHRKYKSRKKHEAKLIEILQDHKIDIVILAGYMRVVTQYFISQYPNKILNIHPAILPSFKGIDAQKQAIEYGVKLAGATVHFVDEKIDHGPIIIQGATIVKETDTREILANRILKIEHRILPQAISWAVEDRIQIKGNKTYLRDKKHKNLADISDLHPCIINPPLEQGF